MKKSKNSLILLFLLFIIGVLPIAWMLGASLWGPQGLTLQHYAVLFQEARTLKLLGNTIALGMLVVAGTLLLGVPLAFVLARTDLPFRNIMGTVLLIPLFLPPYILAVAWSNVLGKRGLLHKWFGLGEPASAFLHSLWGGATILTLAFLPIAILFIKTALAQVHVEIEEATRLEASRGQILRRITLLLIAPAMLSSGILIFVLAISEFAVPMFLGVPVFTSEIFTQFAAFYQHETAVAMSLPLIAIILAAMSWERTRLQDRIFAGEEAAPHLSSRWPLGGWKFVVFAFCLLLFAVSVLLPIGIIFTQSLSWQAYRQAFAAAENGIATSFANSTMGATLLVLLGFIIAYQVERKRAQHFDALLLLMFAVPSTVLGIGLIKLWNQSLFGGAVYNTFTIVLIAYLARFLILPERMFCVTLKQIPPSFEEAAMIDGASTAQIWSRILLPLTAPTMAAAWIIAFIFCFGELGATIMVYPAGGATLSIRLYTIMANSPESVTAAMSVILILPILLAVAVVMLLSKFLFTRELS
jgi:iron(III) transport system permease protein